MKLYAMEAGYLSRLRSDRRELLALARSLGTAAAMREARADLMASARILLSPRTPEERARLYTVDAEGAAHIPIVGELTPSARTDACGAYTAEALTEYGYILAALEAAAADPAVSSVVLDISSPGGYVEGLDQVAQAVAALSKPVTAIVGDMAASAAYWLASQADRVIAASPASRVGSIGVAAEEYDDDAALAADGIAHRVYTSTDAPDKRPDTKTPEGQAKVVAELDALHAVFVRRVAEGRHVSEERVSSDFGRGGVLTAEAAYAVGMVDEVRGSHIARASVNLGADLVRLSSKPSPAGVASSAAATSATIPHKEVHMDLAQLKAEHPEAFAAAVDLGIKTERERREKLLAFRGKSPAVDNAVEAAIAQGQTYAEAMPAIAAAAVHSLDGDNAPAVATAETATGSGAASEAKERSALAALIAGTSKEGK